jgi:hypothetical protein
MPDARDVARAARNLITEHGRAAESIALARAKNATESDRETVAITRLDIAKVVRQMQRRREIASSIPQARRTPPKRTGGA